MKNKFLINIEQLLQGDEDEIIHFANLYSKLNSLPLIPQKEMKAYLAGKPVYLGEQAKEQWGMSFEDARRCLYDVVRTQKLIQGIVAQIQETKKNTKEEIHVIEAGGGTGILAVVAALAGAKVTLLEINSETKKRTKNFIDFLGLSERIHVVFANARNYIPKHKIDLLICECLHTGLALEPQLQILHHFKKFLKPNGKFLPEGVNLRWALANVDWSGLKEKHTEQRNLKNRIVSAGQWTNTKYIDFKEHINREEISEIQFTIPMHAAPANTILIEMDVIIYKEKSSSLILYSGEAEFLGQPHAILLTEVMHPTLGTHASGEFHPGKDFPSKVTPLIEKLD